MFAPERIGCWKRRTSILGTADHRVQKQRGARGEKGRGGLSRLDLAWPADRTDSREPNGLLREEDETNQANEEANRNATPFFGLGNAARHYVGLNATLEKR